MPSFAKQLLAKIADAKRSPYEETEFEVITSNRKPHKIGQIAKLPGRVNAQQYGEAEPGQLLYRQISAESRTLPGWLARLPFADKFRRQRTTYRFAFRRQGWNCVEMNGRSHELTDAEGNPMFESFDLESLVAAA